MKRFSFHSYQRSLPPLLLALSLFILYQSTLAPGLTWAHAGSDGGDLIAAASTGGIAHPTGYPLYLLLARLFQSLPLGSLAYRTNLMSACFTALGAVLVYLLIVRALPAGDKVPERWPAGLAAGLAYGLAPLVWSQAVITEVYALQSTLLLLILYFYSQAVPDCALSEKRPDAWRGLLLGLALGNHVTTAFLVPPALLLGAIRRKSGEGFTGSSQRWFDRVGFDLAAFRRQVAWFGIGLSLYLVLPLRALARPPVNWGNPVTLERFWWLVSGGVYRSYYLPEGLAGVGERLRAFAALLVEQIGLPGILLGLLGLVVFARASRLALLTTWIALVFSFFAIFYRSSDSYVYLIPTCVSFAIWIGMGIYGLARAFSQRYSNLGLILGLAVAAYFLVYATTHYKQVDASQDMRAENFGREILSEAPENALLFAKGDQAVFALWYFHFALEQRPDLTIIAADLLHFDWYQQTLHSTYPSLLLPGPFPWPESVVAVNPSLPACYVEYTNRAEIECVERSEAPGK